MMLKKVLPLAFVLMMPATVVAGTLENGVYSSRLGYTVKVPGEDWIRVDASTVEGMKGHLPENISAKALERFDVIFFPTALMDVSSLKRNDAALPAGEVAPEKAVEPVEFAPTISIIVLKQAPSNEDAEYVKLYAEGVAQAMSDRDAYGGTFKMVSSTKDTLAPGDAFIFNAEFRSGGRDIQVEQNLVFHDAKTYVVTCTQDANEHVKDPKWCRKFVNSMKFR